MSSTSSVAATVGDIDHERSSVLRKVSQSGVPPIQFYRHIDQNKKHIKHVVTIGYRVYPERSNMNIEFVAIIYRNDAILGKRGSRESEDVKGFMEESTKEKKKQDTYVRKNHNNTVRQRMELRPLYATFPMSQEVRENLMQRPVFPNDSDDLSKMSNEEYQKWKDLRKIERSQWNETEESKNWKGIRQ